MSWYLFQSAPAVELRGIKVTDYQQMHRPKINLSWGMNQSKMHNFEKEEGNPIPSTITVQKKSYQQDKRINNMKVLTESSESQKQQDELTKLLKSQNDKKLQYQAIQIFNKKKEKGQSTFFKGKSLKNTKNQQQSLSKFQQAQRLRYLENSLLPSYKRDSMTTIFDYNLNKQVPLAQSRLSGKTIGKNKKNQSNVSLGNGYNIFTAKPEPKKEHIQRLHEMYQYQEKYKKRISEERFQLG